MIEGIALLLICVQLIGMAACWEVVVSKSRWGRYLWRDNLGAAIAVILWFLVLPFWYVMRTVGSHKRRPRP